MKGAGMDESAIERLLGRDLSEGTEAFRDALLDRCLEVLGQADEGIPLDDDALDLLSAAGGVTHAPSSRTTTSSSLAGI